MVGVDGVLERGQPWDGGVEGTLEGGQSWDGGVEGAIMVNHGMVGLEGALKVNHRMTILWLVGLEGILEGG